MDLAPLVSIVGTVSTLGGTALGAWITHSLARNRSINEKIWDQKQTAYSLIVHHSFTILSLSKRISNGYKNDAVSWNNSDVRERLSKELQNEISSLGETISQHFLLLSMDFSKEAVKINEAYHGPQRSNEVTEVEWIEDFYKEMKMFTTSLVVTAKMELMRPKRIRLN